MPRAIALAEYLIQHGGRRKFVQFLDEALATNQWSAAVQQHYGVDRSAALQNTWLAWVPPDSPCRRRVRWIGNTAAIMAVRLAATAP